MLITDCWLFNSDDSLTLGIICQLLLRTASFFSGWFNIFAFGVLKISDNMSRKYFFLLLLSWLGLTVSLNLRFHTFSQIWKVFIFISLFPPYPLPFFSILTLWYFYWMYVEIQFSRSIISLSYFLFISLYCILRNFLTTIFQFMNFLLSYFFTCL